MSKSSKTIKSSAPTQATPAKVHTDLPIVQQNMTDFFAADLATDFSQRSISDFTSDQLKRRRKSQAKRLSDELDSTEDQISIDGIQLA